MTFEEDFPSLKDCPVTLMSGLWGDATLLKIGTKEFKYELQRTLSEDFDLAIPLVAIQKHCIDKQKVGNVIDKVADRLESEDKLNIKEGIYIIELKKELGL